MSDELLLGIDIGTYESKGAIVSVDGKILAQAAVPHNLSLPHPGWAEHDADAVWWRDFCQLSRELIERANVHPKQIAAVGASTIGPAVLPVDADGRPLRPAILYGIDTRAHNQIEALNRDIGEERIFASFCNALSAQATGPKIRWLKEVEPEVYRRTHMFAGGTSYLLFRLTGEWALDYYTATSSGPMFNMTTKAYDPELSRYVVEPERLPPPRWTCEVAGCVTAHAAAETGLAEGTPVIVGTTDASAEAVSVGVVAPGQMMIMYGSTLFFIQVVDGLKPDPRLWTGHSLFPDTYILAGGMATSGAMLRWFRDEFGAAEMEQESRTGANAFGLLAEAAVKVPAGSRGLMALPYFSGERTPINDPQARGVIAGLTLSHSRADAYRALLEGMGYGVRHHLEVMAELGAAPKELMAVGGGTRNPVWLQIISDICGQPQHVAAQTFGASYGDAFLAGLGVGIFKDYRDISRWVWYEHQVNPSPKAKAVYDRYYPLYQKLYLASREAVHALAELGAE
jgi:xylulokinase